MRLLLDTHAALWWWSDAPELGSAARSALASPLAEVHFSAASSYEIHQKVRLGKLALPPELSGDGLLKAVVGEGWRPLDLSVADAVGAALLDHPHRDPFDRMLASQARLRGLTLVSRNPFFQDLGIELLW